MAVRWAAPVAPWLTPVAVTPPSQGGAVGAVDEGSSPTDVLGTKEGKGNQASVLPHTGAEDLVGLAALGAMMVVGGAGLHRMGRHRKA